MPNIKEFADILMAAFDWEISDNQAAQMVNVIIEKRIKAKRGSIIPQNAPQPVERPVENKSVV